METQVTQKEFHLQKVPLSMDGDLPNISSMDIDFNQAFISYILSKPPRLQAPERKEDTVGRIKGRELENIPPPLYYGLLTAMFYHHRTIGCCFLYWHDYRVRHSVGHHNSLCSMMANGHVRLEGNK